jgi:hypothetical protein
VKVVRITSNEVTVTATRQELTALIAAARMSADLMRADARSPRRALALLEGVLADWDGAVGIAGVSPAASQEPPSPS